MSKELEAGLAVGVANAEKIKAAAANSFPALAVMAGRAIEMFRGAPAEAQPYLQVLVPLQMLMPLLGYYGLMEPELLRAMEEREDANIQAEAAAVGGAV